MGYGNTSVSALLSQARAALKKQQSLEEEVAAYEYDLSPKDQESFNKYSDFLSNRVKQVQTTDPSKALSLQRKITGAQRTFSSSELTRESIAIAEGNGSKPQKLNKMISLYRQALENGDENLAQRIQLQADSLQVQIQNEAMAGAGRGGGGGGGSADPQVKGWKAAQSDFTSHAKLLEDRLRSGKITSGEYLGGFTDKKTGAKVIGLRDTMQQIEGIRQSAYDIMASGNGNEDIQDFYANLSDTLKSDKYQNYINQAGNKVANGQIGGSRSYDYNSGTWKFNSPSDKEFDGYQTSPMGALLKLKDKSGDNIVGNEIDPATGQPTNYQVLLPKNQMNLLNETKDGNKITSQQYSGFLPGTENSPTVSYGGKQVAPLELGFEQNAEGKTVGVAPLITMTDPRTGELNRDPITGMIRQFKPEDFGITGTRASNPIVGQGQAIVNGLIDPLVKDAQNIGAEDVLGYGKKKAGEVIARAGVGKTIDSLKKSLGGFGVGLTNPSMNGSGFGSFGVIKAWQDKANELQKQATAKAAAEAQARATQFAADQARLAASNQAALNKQVQNSNLTPQLKNTVLVQSGQQLTSDMGKAAFNNKYLGSIGKLYNGAL